MINRSMPRPLDWIWIRNLVFSVTVTCSFLVTTQLHAAESAEAEGKDPRLMVPKVGEVAIGYPRVFVRVYDGSRLQTGRPVSGMLQSWKIRYGQWYDLNLAESFGVQTSFTAMLDTGANAHMATLDTADRFGLTLFEDVVYIMDGLFDTINTRVSLPVSVALAGTQGKLGEVPMKPFVPVLPAANFGVDLRTYQPAQLVAVGGINLIGMPAIRRHVFEFDPSDMEPVPPRPPVNEDGNVDLKDFFDFTAGPAVNIYPSGFTPTNFVYRQPLRYVDLSRVRASLAGGPTPDMAENPVIVGIRTTVGERTFVGNWLLDTGSPVTIVSRNQAVALGMDPRRASSGAAGDRSFSDITGARRNLPSMKLEKLEMRNPAGQIVEFQEVPVMVGDIRNRQPDGSEFHLDGLIGNNLLLPSVNDPSPTSIGEFVEAPFRRVWIDGYRAELWLEPHEVPEAFLPARRSPTTRQRPSARPQTETQAADPEQSNQQ